MRSRAMPRARQRGIGDGRLRSAVMAGQPAGMTRDGAPSNYCLLIHCSQRRSLAAATTLDRLPYDVWL